MARFVELVCRGGFRKTLRLFGKHAASFQKTRCVSPKNMQRLLEKHAASPVVELYVIFQ